MKIGNREQTCSLYGPNRRGTGPDITDCTLWHGSTGRLNWSYSTYFWGLFSTGDCKSLAIICRVAAVRFDSFSPHHHDMEVLHELVIGILVTGSRKQCNT